MFDSYQKYSGTQYTGTVALLVMAIAAPLAGLFVSRPLGYVSVLIALAFSVLCAGLARTQWKAHSELTILSIAKASNEGKMSANREAR